MEGSNFKVPSKLTTDIMPDCIYHCGYCGGILKEGPQFKEHVMSCYEDIGQQNVDQNHDALLKVGSNTNPDGLINYSFFFNSVNPLSFDCKPVVGSSKLSRI